MIRIFLSIVVFILFSLQSIALPVIINGKSGAGDAFVFRIYEQKDPISGLEVLLDQERPLVNGDFTLEFNIKEIKEVSIKVGLQTMKFFVIPGKTYHLNFNEITLQDQNLFLPQQPLQVVFENEDMLNLVIDGFNYEYQKFLENNFIELTKLRDKSIYYKFESKIKAMLGETSMEDSASLVFFQKYIDYRLAEVQLSGRIQQREELGLKLITHQSIELDNPAYAQFFNKYFDHYLHSFEDGKEYSHLRALLNQGLPINDLFDQLGKDPVLVKEKLRELVLLLSIKQVFYNRDMFKDQLNEILDEISTHSKFEYNRSVAAHMKIELNRFIAGKAVPGLELNRLDGETKDLAHYKGKKTYLMFVSPSCETCEADIRVLKALLKSRDDLQVLAVLAGFDKKESTDWAKAQNADWDFLWFDDDFGLLNEYKIKNFPKYLLLDEESNLLNYFPPSPRENLSTYLNALQAKEVKKEGEASDFFRKN